MDWLTAWRLLRKYDPEMARRMRDAEIDPAQSGSRQERSRDLLAN